MLLLLFLSCSILSAQPQKKVISRLDTSYSNARKQVPIQYKHYLQTKSETSQAKVFYYIEQSKSRNLLETLLSNKLLKGDGISYAQPKAIQQSLDNHTLFISYSHIGESLYIRDCYSF